MKTSSPLSVSFFDDRFDRACLEATSAFGTFLIVDHIGFSFFNGLRGAFFRTGPASHAFFRNDISHWHHPLYPVRKPRFLQWGWELFLFRLSANTGLNAPREPSR